MNFFKKLFSQQTMNIVVGTCICIWVILFTLFIIEGGLFSDSNRIKRWESRIDEWDEFISNEKKRIWNFLQILLMAICFHSKRC